MEQQEVESRVRNLFWEIVHQHEKVSDSLRMLIDHLYPDYSEDTKYQIKQKIMKELK